MGGYIYIYIYNIIIINIPTACAVYRESARVLRAGGRVFGLWALRAPPAALDAENVSTVEQLIREETNNRGIGALVVPHARAQAARPGQINRVMSPKVTSFVAK